MSVSNGRLGIPILPAPQLSFRFAIVIQAAVALVCKRGDEEFGLEVFMFSCVQLVTEKTGPERIS